VEVLPIDLPTALQLVDASNPTVAVARARLQEAYYRQRQAEFLWLPNLQTGPAYVRHDGLNQSSHGDIFPVSKWSFFEGGGAVMSVQLADAYFEPLVARQLTQAEAARLRTVSYNVQLDVAQTYLDLLQVYGQLAVNAEALAYSQDMLRFAEVGREAQMGKTPADLPRARTEVDLRRRLRNELEGRVGEVSARLAQLLLLRPTVELEPADPAIVPINLVPTDSPLDDLVATGLQFRPELVQYRALVGAAQTRLRQARIGPLIPRLDLSYAAGEFGGGINDNNGGFGGRGDGLADAVWTLHNLGAGDIALARQRRAQVTGANFQLVEIQAQVAAEVTASAKIARARRRALASAQDAVRQSEETWKRLREAAFGMNGRARQYDPLEPLIAEQQVAEARTQYVITVIDYNKAQFRLYTALGQPPLDALPKASPLPVEVPVLPGPPGISAPPRPSPEPQPKGTVCGSRIVP
jgi:outer membrane protein TolC